MAGGERARRGCRQFDPGRESGRKELAGVGLGLLRVLAQAEQQAGQAEILLWRQVWGICREEK